MKTLSLCALTLLLGVPLLAAPAKKPAPKPVAKPKPAVKPTPKPYVKPPLQPSAPVVETGPKTWAVLVGVSKYQLSQISGLHYPAIDATGLRDTLTDPKVGGIPTSHILLLTDENATRAKIMGAVDSFLRPNVQDGDRVIVFLAGHGIAKGVGLDARSYLLPNDVKGLTTAALDNTAVPLNVLRDQLNTLPAAQFVVLVDACREDPTMGRGIVANQMSNVLSRSVTVTPSKPDAEAATFFACSVGQRAYEDEKYGHGVFTKWIMEGMKSGEVAEKPSGAINIGRLKTYVNTNVDAWAQQITQSGNFEIHQTPELVTSVLTKRPIVVINRKTDLSNNLLEPSKPLLSISAPDGALVAVNGEKVGVGTVEKVVPSEGDYTITVTKPGYAPVSRSVTALGGYEHQIDVQMEPSGDAMGGATPGNSPAAPLYKNALDALTRQQWEVADQGFAAAAAADPKFTAAYESRYDLHLLQNRNTNALADALGYFGAAPKSGHSLALVSRAYSQFATKGPGKSATMQVPSVSGYGAPKGQADAANLAVKAAREAVAMAPNVAETQLALGYALTAQAVGSTGGSDDNGVQDKGKKGKKDKKDKNKNQNQDNVKNEAIAAFSKAVVIDASDATNQLGFGYGIRAFAAQLQAPDQQKAELNRAVTTLNQAVQLRPDYYEAHRELAYAYVMLDNTDEALKECNLARACRGSAGDVNEVAAIEVTISGLHQKIAQNSTGEEKTAHEEASKSYIEEAQETSNTQDLKVVMGILNSAGVGTSLSSFLPAKLLPFLDIKGTINGKINGAINGKIPGGGNIPGLKIPRF